MKKGEINWVRIAQENFKEKLVVKSMKCFRETEFSKNCQMLLKYVAPRNSGRTIFMAGRLKHSGLNGR